MTTARKPRQYGGRSPSERTTERRERLVRATMALLAREGEASATMTRICAEAGLTERYYYESFAKREEVLVAALDLAAREIAEASVLAIAETEGDEGLRVRAGISALIDLVGRDAAPVRVVVLESAGNPGLRKRRHELLTWFADLVAQEAATLLGPAAWPAPRAHLQATVFVAGYAELVGFWLREEFDLTPEDLIDLGTELFDNLLRRR